MGASFFESEAGQTWLTQLIVAATFVFGNISGVGSERISLFFSLIAINSFVGVSRNPYLSAYLSS